MQASQQSYEICCLLQYAIIYAIHFRFSSTPSCFAFGADHGLLLVLVLWRQQCCAVAAAFTVSKGLGLFSTEFSAPVSPGAAADAAVKQQLKQQLKQLQASGLHEALAWLSVCRTLS
jgi:hypothetical protein